MSRVRGGRRVGQVRRRHDADVESGAPRPPENLSEILNPRVVARVLGIVRKDPRLVVAVLLARDVPGHARRRVGDHRVQRPRHHHPGHVHRIHRQPAGGLPVVGATRDDARRRAVRRAHPVAEEQNDVLRARAPRRAGPQLDGQPRCRGRAVFGSRLDDEGPRRRDAVAAHEEVRRIRRCPPRVLVPRELRALGPRAAEPALTSGPSGIEHVSRGDVDAVDPQAQAARRLPGIRRGLDADVELLARCQDSTIGRHDANPGGRPGIGNRANQTDDGDDEAQ